MFSLTFFTEILVVGILLIVGLSPLWILLLKILKVPVRVDFVQSLGEKSVLVFVVIALAYCLGVLGNRLIDQILPDDGDSTNQQRTMSLVETRKSDKQVSAVNITCEQGYKGDAEDCTKIIVAALSERSESIAGWFERHKSYIRVQRAASISFGLFAFSILIYCFALKARKILTDDERMLFHMWYFAPALLLAGLFFLGYHYENKSYGKAAFLLYNRLPPVKAGSVTSLP